MKFCFEKAEGCCCAPMVNVCVGFFLHMIVHAFVCAIFVFTTLTDPPLYWIDYAFVSTNGLLGILSLLALPFAKTKKCQFMRVFIALMFTIGISANLGITVYYTISRWNATMLTLLMRGLNTRRFPPDPIWCVWMIFSWIHSFVSFYYLFCILSLFCNTYKNHLFEGPYKSSFDEDLPNTRLEVNRYHKKYEDYKPYPVQKT